MPAVRTDNQMLSFVKRMPGITLTALVVIVLVLTALFMVVADPLPT